MTTTRQILSQGPNQISVIGFTKGPVSGWTWDGSVLTHVTGINIRLNPAAAERVTKTADAFVPQTVERISALALHALPEAERAGYEYDANSGDDSNISGCIRRTGGEVTTCDFDTAEVVEIFRTK